MVPHGLRDQDRLEGLSNFLIWKERILIVVEAYNLRDHAEQTLATPTDADLLPKHREAAGHAKRLIMDSIKDHIVPHIAEKKIANEMWKALKVCPKENAVGDPNEVIHDDQGRRHGTLSLQTAVN